MKHLVTILTAAALAFTTSPTQAQTYFVHHFHKATISPYIQVTFVQGDEESVTIDNIIVDSNKLHVEVHSGTLRMYLEGAKEVPHTRDYHSLYPDHAVTATVVYTRLDALSLRGAEPFLCQSPLSAEKFTLRVYGDAKVTFKEAHISRMYTTLYGRSSLDIEAGAVDEQHYTCYGEGKVNTTAIAGQEAKVTAYGEAEFAVNVSDRIRITAFGEARLRYMGNPTILKGIHIGEMNLKRID
ncbi:MAG TPA: DUF2807 domain-containing protein [Puia sp.]|jgi:hypothetical protein|nr:DUF2807 domain-containing protein [Puia sp.]